MMRQLLQRPALLATTAFVAGALLIGLVWATTVIVAGAPAPPAVLVDATRSPSPEAGRALTPEPTLEAPPPAQECPKATETVSTAGELQAALDGAAAGDVIVMREGRYLGNFVAMNSGTPDARITLCGSTGSVLDGGDWGHGYVFHLDGAKYWHLIGFSVTNGQKGVMADGTVGSVIEGLTVSLIGDEAIHLRRFSTDNLVVRNTVSDTGYRRAKFGEGIYIGTAESNWCDISGCQPDASDRNIIEGNTIFDTTSESVDLKEGTSGGILRGNTFDGSSIIEADSWVDVKGNDWLIEANIGTNSPLDGFQTHEILDGWGTRNVFRANTAEVNGPGFGFSLTPERDNVVACSNTASNAGEGTSNVPCSG